MSASTFQRQLDDDPALATAVETVLDRSNDGTEPIQWADVSDDLTSGQWGRLIERDILEAVDGGFAPSDAEALEAALDP